MHETTLTTNWWKYLVAVALIVLVIIAAGAGVEAWFLGMACVLTAFVLTAIGLVLARVPPLQPSHVVDRPPDRLQTSDPQQVTGQTTLRLGRPA